MAASNMGSPLTLPANPSAGKFVMMSPFSGPKGSPFDAKQFNPLTGAKEANATDKSTGALSTGIGFGAQVTINPVAPPSIKDKGFTDDYTPGVTLPSGNAASTAILTAIGGGKTVLVAGNSSNGTPPNEKYASTVPYSVQPLLGFGAGGSRDGGAGPAFTGFAVKMVTAAADVADGAAIEAGFVNRSGAVLKTGYSAFGSATAASVAPTELEPMEEEEEEEPEPIEP